jgi:hypothetical protein
MYSIGWLTTGRDEAAIELLTTVMENIKSGYIKRA